MVKTLRFFPFLHVFFVRILRHPAWRKATRHTLNKAQLTANKGRARTLLQGTTITLVSLVSWENFVVSRCLKYLLFFGGILFVYMHGYVQTLFDLPHSESFGSFNRIIIPALMEKKLKQQSMKPPISRGSNQCLPVFVGPQPPMF